MKKIIQPEFLIDKEKVLSNIKMMKNKTDKSRIVFRPHFKTHQSREIGRWFRELEVDRITVSSLRMAEYFADDEWKDITVAFPVNVLEIERINRLAEKITLNLLVESEETIDILSKKLANPVQAFIKIDVGGNRTGINSKNIEKIQSVYEKISRAKKINPAGLLTHAGNTYHAKSKKEIREIFYKSVEELNSIRAVIDSSCKISIGDTPACSLITKFENIDEIRPGNFVFYDYMQYKLGSSKLNQIAAIMILPVVAKHDERNEVVVYGGAVHLSKESIWENGKNIFGKVVRLTKSGWDDKVNYGYVKSVSQEHGIIKFPHDEFKKVKIGSLLGVIPIHSCLTANLMRKYITSAGEQIFSMNASE
ncbi:MAG: D-TA family PLP-dependent enzyme [Ignavibacteriales bacterium]